MHIPAPSENAEASAGALTAAGRKPRAISATSFKLLTAKLKGAAAPQPAGQNVHAQPEPIQPIIAEPAPSVAEALSFPGVEEDASPATPIAEPAAEDTDPVALLPDFAPIPPHEPEVAIELPEFPALEATPGFAGPAWQDDPLPPIESLFEPPTAIEQPVEETELQPAAALENEAVEDLELHLPVASADDGQIDLAAEPEPVDEIIVAPAKFDSVELQPVLAPHDIGPEELQHAEEYTAERTDVETEAEPPPETVAAPLPMLVAAADESSAPSASKPDDQENGEAKTRASEMAGRVVDAMIKTISTAIYSKPSSSERAAFLREMAAFMAEAANESDIKAAATASVAATASSSPPGPPPAPPAATVEPQAVVPAAVDEALAAHAAPQDVRPVAIPAALANDPFTEPPPRAAAPRPPEAPEADEESGELALTLLDMMSGGSSSLPHERTLAADTLLRVLPRIPVKQLIAVVERVAIMETPPALLVARLIRDTRPEIVGPLLERCSQISDQDLMNAAPDHDTAKLRMIARRRSLSTVLSDYLISTGEPGVLLTLIRNPAAAVSHDAFFRLAEFASRHHALLAPLATRADLPPPVAFELFWHVPQELRRFIFSRFLTDSETLNKILRITLSTHASDANELQAEAKFPTREALDEALNSVSAFKLDAAAARLAELARISRETTMRILGDREGEPLTVLLKALGCSRARFEEVLHVLRRAEDGLLRPDRKPEELQAIFDSLSFNKARILLTYWDWYVRKSGPYAPQN